ncbi:MAG: GspMb/PilO family protein [Vicinamibacterales bacterium]
MSATGNGSVIRRVLAEKRAWVFPLAAALLVNAAAYAFLVYPLSNRVRRSEERAQSDQVALRAAQQDLETAKATESGKARAESELEKFYKEVLPAGFSAARRVLYLRLSQIARESGLQYKRQTLEEPPVTSEDKGPLRKLTLHLALEGSYENIRRFVHALERAPEFIVVENIALAMRGETNSPLVVNLVMSSYYRADAGSGPGAGAQDKAAQAEGRVSAQTVTRVGRR